MGEDGGGRDESQGGLSKGECPTSSMIQPMAAAASILLSAATYLFDFGSNMVVVAEYGRRYAKFVSLERQADSTFSPNSRMDNHTASPPSSYSASGNFTGSNTICDAECRHQTSELTGYFTAMVAVLFCSHTLNALVFWFKFRSRSENTNTIGPFRAAYFLPLIHFWRLADLAWRTLSFKGVEGLRSDDMNGLYNILGSAFESVPMLILQFCAYIVLVKVGLLLKGMSLLFKVSVAASLLSTAYNGGTSVQSVARNGAATFVQKLNVMASAGAFTLCATIARSLTYANMLVWQREHFWRNRTERERARFHASDAVPLLFLGGTTMAYWLLYWLILPLPRTSAKGWGGDGGSEAAAPDARGPKRCLASVGLAYMSILVGPLYCILSEARAISSGHSKQRGQHGLICVVAAANIGVDMGMLGLTISFHNLPVPYLFASLASAAGYVLALAWFIQTDYALLARHHQQLPTATPVPAQPACVALELDFDRVHHTRTDLAGECRPPTKRSHSMPLALYTSPPDRHTSRVLCAQYISL